MPDPTAAFQPHDHADCAAGALRAARSLCARRGLRLTELRRRVLEILLESHRALGAYEILARLGSEGRPAQPPVVYRALDFLTANGLAHRLERLNAWTACMAAAAAGEGETHPRAPVFLICRDCRRVAETVAPGLSGVLDARARALGFQPESRIVELLGRCPDCAAQTEARA